MTTTAPAGTACLMETPDIKSARVALLHAIGKATGERAEAGLGGITCTPYSRDMFSWGWVLHPWECGGSTTLLAEVTYEVFDALYLIHAGTCTTVGKNRQLWKATKSFYQAALEQESQPIIFWPGGTIRQDGEITPRPPS